MDVSRTQLKSEIAELAKLFTEDNNCFRINNQNLDQLSLTFIASSEKSYDLKVNVEEVMIEDSLSLHHINDFYLCLGQISTDTGYLVNSS